jgi:high-affinity nickel-transport protein
VPTAAPSIIEMLSSTSLLLLGFVLGMRHATDADHVVAVTTIVSDRCSLWSASAVGALWGIGHTVTILLVGGAIVVFRLAIPPRLGLAMEFSVAIMLIALGTMNLSGRRGRSTSSTARPVIVGLVHGLAGSAFIALLVVAAVPGAWMGLGYLALFGLGTIAGMALITLTIAVPSTFAARRFGLMQGALRLASGVASVVFGLFLAGQGISAGLFSTLPQWTAR